MEIQTGEIKLEKNEREYKGVKKFLLGVLGVIGSTGVVYFFDKLLESPDAKYIVGVLVLASIFGTVLVMQTLVVSEKTTLVMMVLAETIIPIVVFIVRAPAWMPIGIGALLFLIFVFGGVMNGRKVSENSLDIEVLHVSKVVLTKSVTGLAMFLAIIVYSHYFRWNTWNDDVGRRLLEESIRPTESIVRLYLPVFSFGITVEDALRQFAESEVENIEKESNEIIGNSTPQVGSLPPLAKEKAIEEIISQVQVSLEKAFGSLQKTQRVDHALYDVIKRRVESLSEKSKDAFGIIVAIIVFWVLKSFGAIFTYIIRPLCALVFKALVAVEFIKKTWQSRNQETITL